MRLLLADRNVVEVQVTYEDLFVMSNSLNDVCHAIDKRHFHSRVGVEFGFAQELHRQMRGLVGQVRPQANRTGFADPVE